jgi:formylglycine-generating enzyme required for sulfatase activity
MTLNISLIKAKRATSLILSFIFFSTPSIFLISSNAFAQKIPSPITIFDNNGNGVWSYQESHALIVGFAGSSKSPILNSKLVKVVKILKKGGFDVEIDFATDQQNLERAYNNFFSKFGSNPESRLLIYFAGQDLTQNSEDKFQNKEDDEDLFLEDWDNNSDKDYPQGKGKEGQGKAREICMQAVNRQKIEQITQKIKVKHNILIFDNCFSGNTFSKERNGRDNITISKQMALPIRQFITYRGKSQKTPVAGIFRRQFVSALNGQADFNQDGYVTGSELGIYLEKTVLTLNNGERTVQFGKLRNPKFDRGDFIFTLNLSQSPTSHITQKSVQVQTSSQSSKLPTSSLSNSKVAVPKKDKGQNSLYHLQMVDEYNELKDLDELKGDNIPGEIKDWHQTRINYWDHFLRKYPKNNPYRKEIEEKLQLALETTEKKPVKVKSLDVPDMIHVPSGQFLAGLPSSLTINSLKSFYIDIYEVNQKKYMSVMGNNPSRFKGENLPVESVAWNEAKEFCKKVGKRLPTSLEWEKAARGGTKSKYYWGDTLGKNNANCDGCGSRWSGLKTAPVGSFPPNPLGLYDMVGGVWEWTQTKYSGANIIIRGGSWFDGATFVEPSEFYFIPLENRSYDTGFRCAK